VKKAFTLLELVFVIVVVGILAAIIIPNTKTNPLREAAIQVVSHIRYTQHLAMVDDKFDVHNVKWFQGRWQIVFENATTEPKYSIYSDAPNYTGNADVGEAADDPLNKDKLLSGGGNGFTSVAALKKINSKLNLSQTYGITNIALTNKDGSTNGCKAQTRISFDQLGRPIAGPLDTTAVVRDEPYKNIRLLNKTCVITLTHPEGTLEIELEPETGYVHLSA